MSSDVYKRAREHEKREKVMDVLLGGKIPPQAVMEETEVVGYCMSSADGYDRCMSVGMSSEHFYKEANRIVWAAIARICSRRMLPNLVAVSGELRDMGQLDSIGGLFALTEIRACPSANLEYNCLKVRQAYIHRGRIVAAQNMLVSAYEGKDDPFDALDADRKALAELEPSTSGMVEASDLVIPVIDDVEAAMRGESKSIFIGFRDIDAEYAYEPGELVVIPADSGTGKTAFAWQISTRVKNRNPRIPVLFNCLEMEGKQLVSRDMASSIQISQQRMRTGNGITRNDIAKMATMGGQYKGVWVVKCWTNEQLRSKVRQIRKQLGLKDSDPVVVVSDNLQIMHGDKTGGNREQEVASIGRGAKVLAVEENVLYFMLAQVNKAAGTERPTKKNIRESVAPGNDADWVMVLYSPINNGQEFYEGGDSTRNILEVWFDKVRFGKPYARVKLHMSDYGLIGDMPSYKTEYEESLNLPQIQPNMRYDIPRHDEDQPISGGGGDLFPF